MYYLWVRQVGNLAQHASLLQHCCVSSSRVSLARYCSATNYDRAATFRKVALPRATRVLIFYPTKKFTQVQPAPRPRFVTCNVVELQNLENGRVDKGVWEYFRSFSHPPYPCLLVLLHSDPKRHDQEKPARVTVWRRQAGRQVLLAALVFCSIHWRYSLSRFTSPPDNATRVRCWEIRCSRRYVEVSADYLLR